MGFDLYSDIRKALRRGLELPTRPHIAEPARPPSPINIGWVRSYGITNLLATCGDIRCSHHSVLKVADYSDEIEISNLAVALQCEECGRRGGIVRPDWTSAAQAHQR
jgi:hypothetical protein